LKFDADIATVKGREYLLAIQAFSVIYQKMLL